MSFTLVARGITEGTYDASADVGDVFTPAQNDIIIACYIGNDTATASGWGAEWFPILEGSGTLGFNIWAARIGASPSSGQAHFVFGGGSANYSAAVIQIAGAHTTAPIGVGGSNLFRQVQATTAYDPASPLSITALSAFASATNLSLTIGGVGSNIGLAPKSGFTELLQASGVIFNPNIWAAYKTSEDTAHQVLEEEAGNFDFRNVGGVAIEILEAGPVGPSLTDVDTDEIVTSTQNNVIVTGTSFVNLNVAITQTGVAVTQILNSFSSTSANINVVFETATTDLKYGSANLRANVDGVFANLAISIIPYDSRDYVDLASINSNANNRLVTSPDLAVGDQIEVVSVLGASIANVNLNNDATWDASSDVLSFVYRSYDNTDKTWGATAIQYVKRRIIIVS